MSDTRLPLRELFRPTVFCRHCGHTEESHGYPGPDDPPGSPRLCDVEVSDYGDLDCSCPGFEAREALGA